MARRTLRAGKRGSAGTVKDGDREYDVPKREVPIIPDDAEPMEASVGLSVSVGMSTKFARQKVEVTAWCTLPTYPDRTSREIMFEECAGHVMSELETRLGEVADRFFPEANWEEGD